MSNSFVQNPLLTIPAPIEVIMLVTMRSQSNGVAYENTLWIMLMARQILIIASKTYKVVIQGGFRPLLRFALIAVIFRR
jgi:pantothenate kinase type III